MTNDTTSLVFSLQLSPFLSLPEDIHFNETVQTCMEIYIVLNDISLGPIVTRPPGCWSSITAANFLFLWLWGNGFQQMVWGSLWNTTGCDFAQRHGRKHEFQLIYHILPSVSSPHLHWHFSSSCLLRCSSLSSLLTSPCHPLLLS